MLDIDRVTFGAPDIESETPTLLYFTGVSNELTRAARRSDLGLLGTPAGSTWRQREHYPAGWAADNGCFVDLAKPGSFNAAKWLAWLEEAGPVDCRWATLPDVVGDAEATWRRSLPYVEPVRALGYPIALVMQDGLENRPGMFMEMLDAADCLFVGGSTEWKLSEEAAQLVSWAKQRDKWVHVGRVNSLKRLRYSVSIGADSADGTYLNFGRKLDREVNTLRLFGWLDQVNA